MSYYNSFRDLIGNTPLVKINEFDFPSGINVFAKLELYNPSGSVKDRTGLYMIEDAEKRGILKPGGTIIEATAGNTGLGIAFAALNKNYKVIFVVPDKFSIEKQALMRALGAEIVNTSAELGMLGAVAEAEKLKEKYPDAVSLEQFKNQSNPLAHYETTGKEIYKEMNGKIDYFVAGAGSGGTYTGIMRYLREKNPDVKGILADPYGSTMGGGEHFTYKIEGIGNDFIADTMDMSLVDKVIKVSDDEAFEASRELARKEGIISGSSSGAAFAAVLKLSKEIKSGNIITVLPDRGDRYFSAGLF